MEPLLCEFEDGPPDCVTEALDTIMITIEVGGDEEGQDEAGKPQRPKGTPPGRGGTVALDILGP